MRDIRSNLLAVKAIDPQTINTDTTTVGFIIDTADYDGGVMLTHFANVTAGTFDFVLEESSDSAFGSDVSTISADNLIGTVADTQLSTTKEVATIGINNIKRYVRASVLSAGGANADYSAVYHLNAEVKPVV